VAEVLERLAYITLCRELWVEISAIRDSQCLKPSRATRCFYQPGRAVQL
jgi:hypothetical protein